jgi:O-antigen/teichoic acid export membrane protein
VFDLAYGWGLLRGSIIVGVAYAAGTAYWYADRVLLALLGTSTDVGLYGAAFKYVELSFIPISAISLSIFPVLARAISESEGSRVPHLLQWGVDLMLVTSVPICAFAFVYADGLIRLVGGSEFAAASSALQVLGFLIVAFFVSSVFERALIAGHRERLLGLVNAGILVFNVVLNILFIPGHGYMAVAAVSLATCLAWLVTAGFFARRLFGFTPRLRFAALVALGGLAMGVILHYLTASPIIAGVVALAAYALVVMVPPGSGREIAVRILADVRGLRAASAQHEGARP